MKTKSILITATGIVVPAMVFIILIPKLIEDFGLERFGFISLFWVILGVASIFDMGIARALTHYVAKNKVQSKSNQLNEIWDVLYLAIVWGGFIGVISYFLLNLYFEQAGNLGNILKEDLKSSVIYISFSIPVVVAHAVFRGVLEGLEKFGWVSIVKIITAGVAALLLFSNQNFESTMVFVAISLFFSRLLGLIVISGLVIREIQPIVRFRFTEIKEILVFSGWASLSTFASSIMVYLDRFVAGYFLSPIIYGAYSVVADVVMRFLFIPGAIAAVFYPHVSKSNLKERKKANKRAITYIVITFIPVCLILNMFGEVILSWWLNKEFTGVNVKLIIFILSFGLFVNALAHIPYAFLQGTGNVNLTGKLHVIELIIFAPLLILFAFYWGLIGLLGIWLSRILFDCIGLFFLKRNLDS